MAKITAVSDSGPLMALAKLGLLSKVCSVYPMLTISETVYYEVVTSGSAIGAKDAAEEVSLDMLSELHKGEIETIKIALQLSADYLFIDDFDARQVADANLQKMSAATTVKFCNRFGKLIAVTQFP